jgi:hypothetical protein
MLSPDAATRPGRDRYLAVESSHVGPPLLSLGDDRRRAIPARAYEFVACPTPSSLLGAAAVLRPRGYLLRMAISGSR